MKNRLMIETKSVRMLKSTNELKRKNECTNVLINHDEKFKKQMYNVIENGIYLHAKRASINRRTDTHSPVLSLKC